MYRYYKQMYGTYLSNYPRDKLRKHIGPNAKLPKFLCAILNEFWQYEHFFSVSQGKIKRKFLVFRLFHAHRERNGRTARFNMKSAALR